MTKKKKRFKKARELRKLGIPFATARKLANQYVQRGEIHTLFEGVCFVKNWYNQDQDYYLTVEVDTTDGKFVVLPLTWLDI